MAEERVGIIYDLKDNASKALGGLWKQVAMGNIVAGLASKAFNEMAGFMTDCVKAAAEQEQAYRKLASAMAHQGRLTKEALKDQAEFADKLQWTTGIADEQINGIQASLTTFGLYGEQLKVATKAAIDLSVGLGVDLNTATKLIGKSFQGNTTMLQKFGIRISEAVPLSGKFAEVIKVINGRVGGMAEALGDTLQGKIARVGIAMGELKETIGGALAPVLLALLPIITNLIKGGTDWFSQLNFNLWPALQSIWKVVMYVWDAFSQLWTIWKPIAIWIGSHLYPILVTLWGVLKNVAVVIFGWVIEAFKKFGEWVGVLFKALDKLGRFFAGFIPALQEYYSAVDIAAANMRDFSITTKSTVPEIKFLDTAMVGLTNSTEDGTAALTYMQLRLEELDKAMQETGKNFNKYLVDQVMEGSLTMDGIVTWLKDKILRTLLEEAFMPLEEGTTQFIKYIIGNFKWLSDAVGGVMSSIVQFVASGNIAQVLASAWGAIGAIWSWAWANALPTFGGSLVLAAAAAASLWGVISGVVASIGNVKLAEGGIVTGPTNALIGEAGAEAVIPLDKMGGFGGVSVNINSTFPPSPRDARNIARVIDRQLYNLQKVKRSVTV